MRPGHGQELATVGGGPAARESVRVSIIATAVSIRASIRRLAGGWTWATWFWPGQRRVERLARDAGAAVFGQHVAGDGLYGGPEGARRMSGNPIEGSDLVELLFAQGLAGPVRSCRWLSPGGAWPAVG